MQRRYPAPEAAAPEASSDASSEAATSDAPPQEARQGGVPVWVWWAGAVVLAALVLWLR